MSRVVVRACGVLGSLFLAAQGAQAQIVTKPLATGDYQPIGIARDAQGRVHVTWSSLGTHLHYTLIDGARRRDQVIETLWADRSAIAIDSAGLPHVVYHGAHPNPGSTPSDALIYAHFDGSAWHREDLGPGGYSAAIALDANDRPHIVHAMGYLVANPQSEALEYLHLEDSGWVRERPAGLTVFNGMSFVLAADGHAHLALNRSDGHPVYATNASGDWVAVELANGHGPDPSLALDSLGRPHVAFPFHDQLGFDTVRYVHFDGSQWLSEDLYAPADLPEGTRGTAMAAALVLDAHDRPQILFQTTISDLQDRAPPLDAVVQTYHDGVEWRALPLTLLGVNWTRLLIDPNGVTYGAYAVYRGDSQLAKLVRIALPEVTGEWMSLAVTPKGAGSRVDAVLHLHNDGPGRSKPLPMALYLSADAEVDSGDTLVARRAAPALAAGQSRDLKVSFVRPDSPSGVQLIAVLDPQGKQEDLDRPNNTIAAQLP